MASRNTIDTNILRIRDVFAINPRNSEFIKPESIPVIGENGKLKYYSSLEFFSTISVPTASTNVLSLLESVQPNYSTLSSLIANNPALTSTVAGLGTAGYVSTSFLQRKIDLLSQDNKYISSTTLYDCFVHLADMQWIGNQAGPMIMGSNLNGGYVSTVNPGEYKVYKSTFPLTEANFIRQPFDVNTNLASATIDINGLNGHVVNASKMTIEIQTNVNMVFLNGLQDNCTFNTILTNNADNSILQTHTVQIPYYHSNANICMAKFLLDKSKLTPFPNTLRLRFTQANTFNDQCEITTMIPNTNGIFITLDNLD